MTSSPDREEKIKDALEKGRAYCAYQERCQQEVRDKLYKLGLVPAEIEGAIARLIGEGFVNEERFAKAFAGGKFRMKKWGRVKITRELQRRKISPYCIGKGLAEIPEEDYARTLKELLSKKEKTLTAKEAGSPAGRQKLADYLISKGFESELVWFMVSRKS